MNKNVSLLKNCIIYKFNTLFKYFQNITKFVVRKKFRFTNELFLSGSTGFSNDKTCVILNSFNKLISLNADNPPKYKFGIINCSLVVLLVSLLIFELFEPIFLNF